MKTFLIFRAKRSGMGFSRTHRGSAVCSLITMWEILTGLQQPGWAACDPGVPCKIPVPSLAWTRPNLDHV